MRWRQAWNGKENYLCGQKYEIIVNRGGCWMRITPKANGAIRQLEEAEIAEDLMKGVKRAGTEQWSKACI